MSTSLRKRITKHSPHAAKTKTSASAGSSSPLLSALDHLHKPTVSEESLDPVPPPPLMLPREPDKLRCSPSKKLLQRYRGRNAMENDAPATTRNVPVTRSRSRDSAFKEDFDDDGMSSKNPSSSPKSASTTNVKSTIRKVGGVDFEMLNAAHSPLELPQRSKSAEPVRARSPADSDDEGSNFLFCRRRTSHSQPREKERSDSTVGDIDGETLTLKAKGPSAGSESPEVQSPRGLPIMKKKNSDPSMAARPKIPRVTRSTAAARARSAAAQKETAKALDNDSDSDTSSSEDSDCTFNLDTPTGIQGRSPRKSDPGIQPTRVVPPISVGGILPGLLWASPLSGTSRPDSPWLWCKRWTCCRCSANTIVEQQVCANLTCGHHRCGNRCKVMRDKRIYTI